MWRMIPIGSAIVSLIALGLILWLIIHMLLMGGSVAFSIDFVFGKPLGDLEGGVGPAIVGSLYTGFLSALLASLVSIPLALWLTFLNPWPKLRSCIAYIMALTASIPSIIIGLFGYTFYILLLGMPRSVLVASLTLAVMMIPFIVIRTLKVCEEFPHHWFREALMLGTSPTYALLHLVVPYLWRRFVPPITLAASYAMGATAPILFTGAALHITNDTELLNPFMALPYHLYMIVNEGRSLASAYATAIILLIIVGLMNAISYVIARTART